MEPGRTAHELDDAHEKALVVQQQVARPERPAGRQLGEAAVVGGQVVMQARTSSMTGSLTAWTGSVEMAARDTFGMPNQAQTPENDSARPSGVK